MTLRSTARDAYHVALDFWGCLRRFVDGKAVNGYDDHMAGLLAEGGRAGRRSGLGVAEALVERDGQLYKCGDPFCDCWGDPRYASQPDGLGGRQPNCGLRSFDPRWDTTAPGSWTIQGDPNDLTSAAPGTASPAVAAESPASSDTAASAVADAGHLTSSAAHSLTVDERPGARPPNQAPGHPTFTPEELVDAAGAVTRMALLRGVAAGNVAHWMALAAKFYDAADAIADGSTPPEYTGQLADIGRAALLETLANDPGSIHDRALRQRLDEDERQK